MRTSPFPFIKPALATIKKNNDVRRVLAANGDNGTTERLVQHFLDPEFFPVRKRDQICHRLKELGFTIVAANGDHGLIAEEHREVASPDFDSVTEALERMMSDQGWQYDGWECAVADRASDEGPDTAP